MILDTIVAHKKEEIRQKKALCSQIELESKLDLYERNRESFADVLSAEGISLIAEVKKASPSKGLLRADFDPRQLAVCYEENGASAISVLTDVEFFQGTLKNMRIVKSAVSLPILRKDFLIDPYQIYEAKVFEADAVLLIAAILNEKELSSFLQLTRDLHLDALVEVHCREELDMALGCGAKILGINNRDLRTFKTDLKITFELAETIPDGCLLVSESGISTAYHLKQLEEAGVDAVLVGEAIVTSTDVGNKVRELAGR